MSRKVSRFETSLFRTDIISPVCLSSKKDISSVCIFSNVSVLTACCTRWAKTFEVTPHIHVKTAPTTKAATTTPKAIQSCPRRPAGIHGSGTSGGLNVASSGKIPSIAAPRTSGGTRLAPRPTMLASTPTKNHRASGRPYSEKSRMRGRFTFSLWASKGLSWLISRPLWVSVARYGVLGRCFVS